MWSFLKKIRKKDKESAKRERERERTKTGKKKNIPRREKIGQPVWQQSFHMTLI